MKEFSKKLYLQLLTQIMH